MNSSPVQVSDDSTKASAARSAMLSRPFPQLRSAKHASAIVFLLALVPRIAYVAVAPTELSPDATAYLASAMLLWNEGTLGVTSGHPTASLGAAYPMFLMPFVGIFGNQPLPALLVQCILGAGAASIAYCLGHRIGGQVAGWLSGLTCAAYLPLIKYSGYFLTEVLASFLMLLGLLFADNLLRATTTRRTLWWGVATGIVFALHALTRPIAFPLLVLPLILYGVHMFRRPRRVVAVASVTLLSFAVTYSPWIIRNYFAFDELIVLKPGSDYMAIHAFYHATFINEGHNVYVANRLALQAAKRDFSDPARLASVRERMAANRIAPVWTRLRVMMGAHPCLKTSIPFSGYRIRMPPPIPGLSYIRRANYAWYFSVTLCMFFALLLAIRRKDLRLLQATLLPLAIVGGYSLVHAIPRYQVVPFAAFSVAAGIGGAVLLTQASRLKALISDSVTRTAS